MTAIHRHFSNSQLSGTSHGAGQQEHVGASQGHQVHQGGVSQRGVHGGRHHHGNGVGTDLQRCAESLEFGQRGQNSFEQFTAVLQDFMSTVMNFVNSFVSGTPQNQGTPPQGTPAPAQENGSGSGNQSAQPEGTTSSSPQQPASDGSSNVGGETPNAGQTNDVPQQNGAQTPGSSGEQASEPTSSAPPSGEPTSTSPTGQPNGTADTPAATGTTASSAPADANGADTSAMNVEFSTLFGPGHTQITEEQLYATNTLHLLSKQSPELGEKFARRFEKEMKAHKGEQNRVEISVANALKSLVKDKLITQDRAEHINGRAFHAAQLDSNKDAAWDNSGNTKAVAGLEKAFAKALDHIDHKHAAPRKLEAPAGGAYQSSVG